MQVDGKILLVGENILFLSRGLKIFSSIDNGISWNLFSDLPSSFFVRIISQIHLLARVKRLGVHHMTPDNQGGYYVFFNTEVCRLNSLGKVIGVPENIHGSRPLCITTYQTSVLYGEYTSNSANKPITLYSYDGYGQKSIQVFEGIRHIHGVFLDSYTNEIYITTGDYGDGAGIWRIVDNKLNKIMNGSQQERAVQLLFNEEYIYYGTDTPLEQNYIYRISKKTMERDRLGEVESSIFYGITVKNKFYFSTVAEPSRFNIENKISIWQVQGRSIRKVEELQKDILPMKIFQYGQVTFPYYQDKNSSELWLYELSTTKSGKSRRVEYGD